MIILRDNSSIEISHVSFFNSNLKDLSRESVQKNIYKRGVIFYFDLLDDFLSLVAEPFSRDFSLGII